MTARVLLVDDQPDHVEMYRLALEHAGFTVIEAETGAAGIDRAGDSTPDVVVLDIRLPDMTGWDVCRALKANAATTGIPIIILTAAASKTLAREAEEHGCVAHLLKPCYPNTLIDTIRRVLAEV